MYQTKPEIDAQGQADLLTAEECLKLSKYLGVPPTSLRLTAGHAATAIKRLVNENVELRFQLYEAQTRS
jgi:hypothetical protein